MSDLKAIYTKYFANVVLLNQQTQSGETQRFTDRTCPICKETFTQGDMRVKDYDRVSG